MTTYATNFCQTKKRMQPSNSAEKFSTMHTKKFCVILMEIGIRILMAKWTYAEILRKMLIIEIHGRTGKSHKIYYP